MDDEKLFTMWTFSSQSHRERMIFQNMQQTQLLRRELLEVRRELDDLKHQKTGIPPALVELQNRSQIPNINS